MTVRARAGAVIVAAAVVAGCAGTRRAHGPAAPPGLEVASYRVAFERPGRETARLRAMLFAAPPDRLHAELSGAIGGTRVIVDAGGGRVAITSLDDRTAFVGPASRETLKRAFGLDVSVESLVDALLYGRAPAGEEKLERSPATSPGLPRRFRLTTPTGTLALTRRSLRALAPERAAAVGRGEPPPGVERRPIEDLAADALLGEGAR